MAVTDPDHWFLDSSQTPRRPEYTSRNLVTPLIDGSAYMTHLSNNLSRVKKGDYVNITGWRVSPHLRLLGEDGKSPQFGDQIVDLIKRDAAVRAIVWHVPGSSLGRGLVSHVAENLLFVRIVNSGGGQAILDARFPPFLLASHHQKAIVLRANGDDWAYVGGTDIAVDRWDTNLHDGSPQRLRGAFDAWHDAHAVARGEIVAQVWDNFAERWNDPNRPNRGHFAPGMNALPEIDKASRPSTSTNPGRHHVQLLRTLASGGTYPFAPDGEQTVRLAYEKAISRAQHYVYIEDQYFWPCSVVSSLREAAARGVKIVLVLAKRFGGPLGPWHNSMRQRAIEYVRADNPDSVFVYHLESASAYGQNVEVKVHSKIMIIDDRFAAIGSANITRRSFTTDSELHLAIVDDTREASEINGSPAEVCRFAKELRIQLWQEHLGIADRDLIEDPIDPQHGRPSQWPISNVSLTAASDGDVFKHRVVTHHVPRPRWSRPRWITERLMNPDGGSAWAG